MSRSVWCVIASMSVACAAPARFLPDSDVERSSRDPSAGVVTRGGVTLVADAERWSGHPATLGQLVDPPATMVNATGDTVSSMLVARALEGPEWMDLPQDEVEAMLS